MEEVYLGIEVGGTKIQILVSNRSLEILESIKFFVGDVKEASVILDGLREKLRVIHQKYTILSSGLGFGGPLDYKTGEVFRSFQVLGWENINLKNWLEMETCSPAYLDNDANVAALGEACMGAGADYTNSMYITLGSGVGAGFTINKQIYHGKTPGEFELGHIPLSKNGPSLESSCSAWALNKKLLEYVKKNGQSPLAKLKQRNRNDASFNLIEAIDSGDIGAKNILHQLLEDLAFGLSHVVHVINPDIIIIGGGLSNLGSYITDGIKSQMPKYLMETMKNQMPNIQLSVLKESAVPMGALVLASSNHKE